MLCFVTACRHVASHACAFSLGFASEWPLRRPVKLGGTPRSTLGTLACGSGRGGGAEPCKRRSATGCSCVGGRGRCTYHTPRLPLRGILCCPIIDQRALMAAQVAKRTIVRSPCVLCLEVRQKLLCQQGTEGQVAQACWRWPTSFARHCGRLNLIDTSQGRGVFSDQNDLLPGAEGDFPHLARLNCAYCFTRWSCVACSACHYAHCIIHFLLVVDLRHSFVGTSIHPPTGVLRPRMSSHTSCP